MTVHQLHLVELYRLVEERLGIDARMRTGINLADVLDNLIETDLATYLTRLQTEPTTHPLWQRLIKELTIGETYFFRNQSQFRLLREHIMPSLLQKNQDRRRLTVWCVGCATGEEAYSVAIVLREMIPDFASWKVSIVASDINSAALETARQGIYRDWSFRHANDGFLQRNYFDEVDGGYRLSDEIRRLVTFQYANLLDMSHTSWVDLILCRNVMLYFKDAMRKQGEEVLLDALQSEGWLLLGHAEALYGRRAQWDTHIFAGAIAYQKKPVVPSPTDSPQPGDGDFHYHKLPTTDRLMGRDTLYPVSRGADELYFEAMQAYHDKDYDKADRILKELLTRNAKDARARVLLAAVFGNRGAIPEAHAQLDMVMYQHPLYADGHYLRAMLHLEMNHIANAEKSLRAALYSRMGHPLAAFHLGNLRAIAGDNQRAQNLWEQALDTVANHPPEAYFSDLYPRTAGDFATLIRSMISNYGDTPNLRNN